MPNPNGEFYKAAEKWNDISYHVQQPSVSGDNYIIPGDSYVALNSACYTSPSAMSWVDDYDCKFAFSGTTIANCYYTSADNYSDGPSPFIAPAFEWLFSGCDAGYYVDSSISNDTSFVTIPVAGSTSFESNCVAGTSDTERSLMSHHYTFLGLSNSVVDSGYPISLYSGCALCPAMDDISNISDAEYLSSVSVPSANTKCYKNVTARGQKGTFSIENCWYPE